MQLLWGSPPQSKFKKKVTYLDQVGRISKRLSRGISRLGRVERPHNQTPAEVEEAKSPASCSSFSYSTSTSSLPKSCVEGASSSNEDDNEATCDNDLALPFPSTCASTSPSTPPRLLSYIGPSLLKCRYRPQTAHHLCSITCN